MVPDPESDRRCIDAYEKSGDEDAEKRPAREVRDETQQQGANHDSDGHAEYNHQQHAYHTNRHDDKATVYVRLRPESLTE